MSDNQIPPPPQTLPANMNDLFPPPPGHNNAMEGFKAYCQHRNLIDNIIKKLTRDNIRLSQEVERLTDELTGGNMMIEDLKCQVTKYRTLLGLEDIEN